MTRRFKITIVLSMAVFLLVGWLLAGCTGERSIEDRLVKNPFMHDDPEFTLYKLKTGELALRTSLITENVDRVFFRYRCTAGDGWFNYLGTAMPDDNGVAEDLVAFNCPGYLIVQARGMKYEDDREKKYQLSWKINSGAHE